MKRLLWLCLLGACSSSPTNVAGDYTVAVTNEDNGCNFQNWTVGQSATGVQVTITQSGDNATAVVMGGGGLILGAVFGSNAFAGPVDGDVIDLKLDGTKANNTGNCTYTYNGEIKATLAGDTLSGTIDYVGAGNGNSDCAGITGCLSFQDFNGTRPPK